jgi:hypothetical protein
MAYFVAKNGRKNPFINKGKKIQLKVDYYGRKAFSGARAGAQLLYSRPQAHRTRRRPLAPRDSC